MNVEFPFPLRTLREPLRHLRLIRQALGYTHPSMNDSINWDEIRKQFPVTEKLAYLNSAAAGPVSRASQAAPAGYYEQMMHHGDGHCKRWPPDPQEHREQVAPFL